MIIGHLPSDVENDEEESGNDEVVRADGPASSKDDNSRHPLDSPRPPTSFRSTSDLWWSLVHDTELIRREREREQLNGSPEIGDSG